VVLKPAAYPFVQHNNLLLQWFYSCTPSACAIRYAFIRTTTENGLQVVTSKILACIKRSKKL